MNNNYVTSIETVVVEVNGQTLDSVSFTSPDKAHAYKRSVRQWAGERGVIARVFAEVMEISHKEPRIAPAPSLAVA